MELRKHLNWRGLFGILYTVAFAVYIIVGLQPAGAADYVVSTTLEIPGIALDADVTELELEDGRLNTPDTIVGSYSRSPNKTLLIGHSTTIFRELDKVKVGDTMTYDGKNYTVTDRVFMAKGDISMTKLLRKADSDTLVLMTCAGELLEGGDATHRLIITALIQ